MQKVYAQDGVNIAEGDDFSSYVAEICRSTYNNSRFLQVKDLSRGHFRGPRGVRLVNLPDSCYLDVAPDGIGTKVIIINEALSQFTAGRDVLAMTVEDISRWGGLPLLFSNVYDVATLGHIGDPTNMACRSAFMGLVEAANEQEIVLYKGETAELGVCVGSENPDAPTKFNWAGFALGVYDENKVINGDTLRPGQKVIALREHGFRANGGSSVRKALRLRFGDQWWKNPEASAAIRAAAEPSIIYSKFLAFLNGWFNPNFRRDFRLHAIVHITGGGIPSKFGNDILFPRGLSANLDNLWYPPKIMSRCFMWRNLDPENPLTQEEGYEIWHGGQGMLLVADDKDVKPIIQIAKDLYGIEARECGRITEEAEPTLKITSRFDGEVLTYTKNPKK